MLDGRQCTSVKFASGLLYEYLMLSAGSRMILGGLLCRYRAHGILPPGSAGEALSCADGDVEHRGDDWDDVWMANELG
jgi:hypothetical protein